MPTATLACPRCSQSLKTTRPFDVGSRFRCPKCGASFAARPEDVPAPAYGVRPLPSTANEAPRGAGPWLLLLSVVGLGLLLLAGAGAALALHFFMPRKEAQQAVVQPAPAADDGHPFADDGRPLKDGAADSPEKKDPPKPLRKPVDLPPSTPPPDLAPDPPQQSWLPPEEQEKVNAAINRGVAFLMKTQLSNGCWPGDHPVGMAALPGLTLLECGVPATDPHVRKAADFVRHSVRSLGATYELALAILFLDRLGEPEDDSLIRFMALRLLAGETPAGGWTYDCPILSEKEEGDLLTILEATRPQSSLELIATKNGDNSPTDLFTGRTGDNSSAVKPGGATIPFPSGLSDDLRTQAKQMYDGLSPQLKAIPALKPPTQDERMPNWDNSDNSNTQFATLGLWAAGRHGVPMERALALLAKRFQVSQGPDGAWSYQYRIGGGGEIRPAMTGAGLLGLAVGRGLTADLKAADVEAAGEDPLVEKGMKALSQYIGQAHGRGNRRVRNIENNYYFLWSVERVGMLYGRKTIGDKQEWYPWGVEDFLESQGADGNWRGGTYPGARVATDASFALLFLKRTNLAKDLTTKLELLTRVKQP